MLQRKKERHNKTLNESSDLVKDSRFTNLVNGASNNKTFRRPSSFPQMTASAETSLALFVNWELFIKLLRNNDIYLRRKLIIFSCHHETVKKISSCFFSMIYLLNLIRYVDDC